MRWRGKRKSTQVEDRRGQRGRRIPGGRGAGLGCGGIVLLIVLALATGQDPLQLISTVGVGGGGGGSAPGASIPGGGSGAPGDELGEFASVVLADLEDTWSEVFPQQLGRNYQLPGLVLFTGEVGSACGWNSAAVGPFYCPADEKIYIDLSFFDQLGRRFGAPGDFAQAYVIAHEVGHHVQNELGISETVHRMQQQSSERKANELSVRLELQADCLAGVWAAYAHNQRQLLEPGDVEEGLRAAAAIGDDQMQRQAGRRVRPESWTHGSSDQRMRWLRKGMETADPDACDTFQADRL